MPFNPLAVRGPLLSPSPGTPTVVGAVYNATAPAPQDEQGCSLQCDSAGNLLVNVAVGGGGGGGSNVNLVQVGGVPFSLGQQLAAQSLPVVLTAAQIAALTPLSTVTVLQGTSPWVVSGTVTITPSGLQNVNVTEWNTVALGSPSAYGTSPGAVNVIGVNAFITNTVPVTLASTTITGTVAVTQSTSPWVVSLASTTVTNTVAENLIQVAGVTLGATAVTNFGTAPAAAAVPGVNASLFAGTTGITATGSSLNVDVTNTVPVTLASTTITGTVSVTQGTTPWVVAGSLTNNNAAPTATLIGVLGAIAETAYNTVTYTTGDMVLPVTDLHGALNEDLQAVAGVQIGATSVVAFGSAPAAVNVEAVNASIFSGATALTNTAGALNVNVTNTGTPFTVEGDETNNAAAPEAAAALEVLPAIANAASPSWTEGFNVLLSVDLLGRQRIRGTLTPNNAAPGSDGQMALTTIANAVAPTYTEGDLVLASVDLNGATRIVGTRTNNNAAPSFEVGVLPALANAASPSWTEGNQVLESVDLTGRQRIRGTLTNNNAAPTADLIEVMPAVATTAAPTYTTGDAVMLSTDLSGNLRVTPTAVGTLTNNNAAPGTINLGVLPAVANAAAPTWTEGDQVLLSVDLHGAQRVSGATGQNVAPLAFELVTGGVFNTTIPALTAGNASQFQTDSTGAQAVNTAGRKQTYRCSVASTPIVSASFSPTFSVTGSATKTVRINRIRLSCTAATGTVASFFMYRYSALSGGTAVSQSNLICKMDINNAANTAVVNFWTVAATTVTPAGSPTSDRYEIVTPAVTVPVPYIEWLFGDNHGQELVLRGTSDFIGVCVSVVGTTPTLQIMVEWTEE